MGNRQAVLLHNSLSKKRQSLALLVRLLTGPEDRWRLSPMPLLNRCTVYLLKNKSDLAPAPPLISRSLAGRRLESHLLGDS